MNEKLIKAKEILAQGEYTCVICAEDKIITDKERGVAPILKLLRQDKMPQGSSVADKVVGKAVALLLAKAQANCVYAEVLSKRALPVLQSYGIDYYYKTLTDVIINRRGDDICPMEKAVEAIGNAEEGYQAIIKQYEKLNAGK